jgi:hypothetical protein
MIWRDELNHPRVFIRLTHIDLFFYLVLTHEIY